MPHTHLSGTLSKFGYNNTWSTNIAFCILYYSNVNSIDSIFLKQPIFSCLMMRSNDEFYKLEGRMMKKTIFKSVGKPMPVPSIMSGTKTSQKSKVKTK